MMSGTSTIAQISISLRTEKQGGGKLMFMPFDIVSICVLQLIHNYINSTC